MTVTTDLLTRYLFDDLTPPERAALEAHLAAHPTDAARLAQLHSLRATLEADAEYAPVPPANLVTDTVARTAEYLVANGAHRPEPERSASPKRSPRGTTLRRWVADPMFFGWRRADVAVAFTIGLLAVGLGLGAVSKLRQDSQLRLCQNNLRTVHSALMGYSDTHGGRFPQVGTPSVPVAAAFALELSRAGQLGSDHTIECPAVEPRPGEPAKLPPGYAYTLGYRAPTGQLIGFARPDDSSNTTVWTPLAADPPSAPHAHGQNVLYAGGTVRYTLSPAAGEDGDHIYRNDAGLVRAGLHRYDAALGTGTDIP